MKPVVTGLLVGFLVAGPFLYVLWSGLNRGGDEPFNASPSIHVAASAMVIGFLIGYAVMRNRSRHGGH